LIAIVVPEGGSAAVNAAEFDLVSVVTPKRARLKDRSWSFDDSKTDREERIIRLDKQVGGAVGLLECALKNCPRRMKGWRT